MKSRFSRAKSIRRLLLVLCLFLATAVISANENISPTPLSSLEQAELLINNGSEVWAALSAVARDEKLQAFQKQITGTKHFESITYGHSNEPVSETSTNKYSYGKLGVTGGLVFPVMGTLQKEKIGKLETETATMNSKHHLNMLLLNNLVSVRKAYTTLWIEQQKEEFAKRFLNTEAETIHILQERQAKGLLLPVDRLEFLAVYNDIRRDLAASKLRQIQALNIIRLATGHKWEAALKIKEPSLPSVGNEKIDINTHPDVIFQNDLVSQYKKLYAEKNWIDRDAHITVGLTGTRDFPGTTGTGVYIAFSTSGAVRGLHSGDNAKLAAAEDLNRAKYEETFMRLKLNGQAEEALATAAYAASDVSARTSRLIVMAESIREKMLRRMVLPGDTFEQLQRSKSQYYRTALEMLDNEEVFLHSAIDVISYVYPKGLSTESKERVFLINENNTLRNNMLAPNWLDAKDIQYDMNKPLDFSNIADLKIPGMAVEPIGKMPGITLGETPVSMVEKKSVSIVEETPVSMVEETPISIVEEKPISMVEETPVSIVEEKPVSMVEEMPVSMVEETPVSMVEETPVNMVEEKPVSMIEETPVSMVEETQVSIVEETQVNMVEETQVNMVEEKPVSMIEETPVSMVEETQVSIVEETQVSMVEETQVSMVEETPVSMVEETPVNQIEKLVARPIIGKTAMPLEKIPAVAYVWNAQPFLQSDTMETALNKIIDARFSRILISLTSKQISHVFSAKGKAELDALIFASKSKGVRIDLMLGDPTWVKAAHREELLSLIKELQIFDFDGIHLDIEPDSLPEASTMRPQLFVGLADTVKAVKEITTLPVSISIHPRYLEGYLGTLARKNLLPLGLEEVVVMIYTDNPHSTAQRMAAIITSNPGASFSLAQSIEKNIPLNESYAKYTPQEFKAAIHILESNLAGHGLKGIYIQAWEDYEKGEAE